MRNSIIYISGRYTAPTHAEISTNIELARSVAVEGWNRGFTVLCPHLNASHFERDCQCSYEDYIVGDLELLRRCDAVLMLPGWEQSNGAKQERAEALDSGIPVVEYPHWPSPDIIIGARASRKRGKDTENTGAKERNKVLPRYDLIPPSSLRRLALVYTEGAEHYGAYNWCEGYPYSDILNHALEHLNRYLQGDHSEDQLAKVAWAMFTLMFFDETGRGELNDIRWVGRQMSGKEADEIDAMIEQCLAETQTASA